MPTALEQWLAPSPWARPHGRYQGVGAGHHTGTATAVSLPYFLTHWVACVVQRILGLSDGHHSVVEH